MLNAKKIVPCITGKVMEDVTMPTMCAVAIGTEETVVGTKN